VLAAVLLSVIAAPAPAQTGQSLVVRGPVAAILWGPDEGAIDVELRLIASGDLAPAQGEQPPAGPRMVFSATRLSALGGTLIRRHWFGSAPLPAGALSISSDLSEATLDAEVDGTLQEVIGDRTPTERAVKGRLQVRWVANAAAAEHTIAHNNQSAPYPFQLSIVGQGRRAEATVTLTVDGLGGPLQVTGPGTLLSPATGVLNAGTTSGSTQPG
jgi:hypothetical protein